MQYERARDPSTRDPCPLAQQGGLHIRAVVMSALDSASTLMQGGHDKCALDMPSLHQRSMADRGSSSPQPNL